MVPGFFLSDRIDGGNDPDPANLMQWSCQCLMQILHLRGAQSCNNCIALRLPSTSIFIDDHGSNVSSSPRRSFPSDSWAPFLWSPPTKPVGNRFHRLCPISVALGRAWVDRGRGAPRHFSQRCNEIQLWDGTGFAGFWKGAGRRVADPNGLQIFPDRWRMKLLFLE